VKLSIERECFDDYETERSQVSVLPSGQMLVGVCDALCMLDADRKVVWEYHVPQMLFNFVLIPATGLIYGTAADNTMFILEAASGKELLLQNGRNGSAAYGEVKPYGDDICLVTDNNWGYRERNPSIRDSIKDGVTAWRGTEVLWHTELPPGADLIVEGNKILALTKTQDGLFIKEIAIPVATSR
jgi:hypothetical protein